MSSCVQPVYNALECHKIYFHGGYDIPNPTALVFDASITRELSHQLVYTHACH